MLVKDLMTTKVITVKPSTLVSEVADILHTHHITGLPVVNDEGIVLGTISERDFITAGSDLYLPTYIKLLANMDYVQGGKKQLPYVANQIVKATAVSIMNRHVPFVRPETTLEQVASIFAYNRVNPVPVTDEKNKLLGVISRSDLIKFFSPSQVHAAYVPENRERMIDNEVKFAQTYFKSRFAYVAKARANIWLTATVVLFIVGFVLGIVYVTDPNLIFKQDDPTVNYP
jgi:CBS domain-containing protein